MFERPHHVRIAAVLQSLDADWLEANGCLFGGGTAIALSCGEFRESLDIDFLVSARSGYAALRQKVTSAPGLRSLSRRGTTPIPAAPLRIDQYGVRAMVDVDGVSIKLEFVVEGRIDLEPPGPTDRICGLACLTRVDLATTKLLANSDRWADDAVASRDLIDLAMLKLPRSTFDRALARAASAYGSTVERDLARAITRLGERTGRLEECMTALKMTGVPRAVLWKRIKRLEP